MAEIERIYVKPATGGRILDPSLGSVLPPQGAFVSYDAYWAGKLAHGDVERAEPPAEEPAAQPVAEAAAPAAPEPEPPKLSLRARTGDDTAA